MSYLKPTWHNQKFFFALFVGFIVSTAQVSQAGDSGPAKVEFFGAGSGVNTPVMKLLVEAFLSENKGEPIQILPSLGTSGGIKALIAGKIDFALASRALKGDELKAQLTESLYAKSILVFAANSSVPDTNLNSKDIVEIYKGVKTKWANGSNILVLMREEGDSGAELLVTKIPELKNTFRDAWKSSVWRVEYNDSAALASVVRLKNSVVWSDYSNNTLILGQTKILSYNNTVPSEKTAIDGTYPLVRDLTIVYKDPPPARLRSFFDFIHSKKGSEILRKYNAVPIQ